MRQRQTMMLNDWRRIQAFAATLSASLLLALFAAGTAHASAPGTQPTTISGCNELPLSQREFCKSQVGSTQVTPAHVAINAQASAATRAEMARCKSLPYSDKLVCEDQAGYGQKVPESLAPNQRIALQKPNAEYKAAVAACKRMPVSDWNTCISQAGYDTRLARAEG